MYFTNEPKNLFVFYGLASIRDRNKFFLKTRAQGTKQSNS
jgi:hypothetical protein